MGDFGKNHIIFYFAKFLENFSPVVKNTKILDCTNLEWPSTNKHIIYEHIDHKDNKKTLNLG
jgi:hypothetical protein